MKTTRLLNSISREIVLCDTCGGDGYIEESELEDYHRGEYRYWNELCPRCQGSGRFQKKTIIEYSPFEDEEVKKLTFEKLKE